MPAGSIVIKLTYPQDSTLKSFAGCDTPLALCAPFAPAHSELKCLAMTFASMTVLFSLGLRGAQVKGRK